MVTIQDNAKGQDSQGQPSIRISIADAGALYGVSKVRSASHGLLPPYP